MSKRLNHIIKYEEEHKKSINAIFNVVLSGIDIDRKCHMLSDLQHVAIKKQKKLG